MATSIRSLRASPATRATIRRIDSSSFASQRNCIHTAQTSLRQATLRPATRRNDSRNAIFPVIASYPRAIPATPTAFLHGTSAARSPAAARRHPVTGEPVPEGPPTTDFDRMDILGDTPVPATAVDACLPDGFALSSGLRITGGSGALLVGGEAFAWRPWSASAGADGHRLVNARGQWDVPAPEIAFALLGLVWPRPDLLILGLGPHLRPVSSETRRYISSLGMRVEVLDTRNAAAQFNLLATERGVEDVAAALIPLGWKEGVGVE